jgi:CelD/BcsL family acetyltransferase involved in cellulose biosynthesis
MAQILAQSLRHDSTLEVQVVREAAAWLGMRQEWEALASSVGGVPPPLHFDWLATWWEINREHYAAGEQALCVLCFRRRGELVGALPLYYRRSRRLVDGGRWLGFVSTGEAEADEICPDYMDMVCRSEVAEQCAGLAMEVLCEDLGESYERMALLDMADHSPLVRAARRLATVYDLETAPRGVCPIADLSGGFEAYLSRLSASTRTRCRHLVREARKRGTTFEVAEGLEQARSFMEELVALHQKRWQADGKPGCFASRPFAEFHRRLVELWQPQGKVVLSRLRLEGRTLAVKYGFCGNGKYDFYQSGVLLEENGPLKSPGVVSFLMLMEHLTRHGVQAFDFLRGNASYKQRLATSAQPLVEVRRVVWNWRTSVSFAADMSGRVVRKAYRRLLRRRTRANTSSEGDRA